MVSVQHVIRAISPGEYHRPRRRDAPGGRSSIGIIVSCFSPLCRGLAASFTWQWDIATGLDLIGLRERSMQSLSSLNIGDNYHSSISGLMAASGERQREEEREGTTVTHHG
jgi:hypothetical protein